MFIRNRDSGILSTQNLVRTWPYAIPVARPVLITYFKSRVSIRKQLLLSSCRAPLKKERCVEFKSRGSHPQNKNPAVHWDYLLDPDFIVFFLRSWICTAKSINLDMYVFDGSSFRTYIHTYIHTYMCYIYI